MNMKCLNLFKIRLPKKNNQFYDIVIPNTRTYFFIIPYMAREEQLKKFLPSFENYLNTQEYIETFKIVVAHQDYPPPPFFNRGALINATIKCLRFGFKSIRWDDVIWDHPIDHIPKKVNYEIEPYQHNLVSLEGKAFGILLSSFLTANGYSNHFVGWGFEDHDYYAKCSLCGISLEYRSGKFEVDNQKFPNQGKALPYTINQECFNATKERRNVMLSGLDNIKYSCIRDYKEGHVWHIHFDLTPQHEYNMQLIKNVKGI